MSSHKVSGVKEVNPVIKNIRLEHKEEACWQSKLKSPVDRLAALYNLSRLTDLTITFPQHHQELQVHRLVLAMSSPVFENMLFGPLAEGSELILPEDPPEAFNWLIQHIYCGTETLPDVAVAVKIYNLANKYQMDELCSICSEYLVQNLNGDNLPLVLETAHLLEDERLLKECGKVMSYSAGAVLSSPNIGQLSLDYLRHFLKQDLYIPSETLVFMGLVEWGKMQTSNASLNTDVHQVIRELLPFVRFLTMSCDEFVEHVLPANILTLEEVKAILLNIKKVKSIPLPDICSAEQESRFILDWKKIHTVSLSARNQGFFGNAIQNTIPARQEYRQKLISELKFTKNIQLGSIKVRFSNYIQCTRWTVEVTDSSETVLGTVKQGISQQETPINVSEIEATFSTPLFLRSNKIYTVWLHSHALLSSKNIISTQYRSLHISCCFSVYGDAILSFWCFDDSL